MIGAPASVAFVSKRSLSDLTGYARYSSDVLCLLRSMDTDVSVLHDILAADERHRWLVLSHLDAVRLRDARRWRGRRVLYVAHNEEVAARLTVARFDRWPRRFGQLARVPWTALRQAAIIGRAKAVIAISDEDAARFRWRYGVDPIVLPPALMDFPRTDAVSPPRIVLWGSYRWSVKRENALWALRDVIPLVDGEVPVTVAGLDANRLRQSGAGTTEISFEESLPDPSSLFASRPLILIAERQTGGVKLKTLDAATAACPIVSTPSGIEGTGLSHGKGALVGHTASELALHIERLITDWPQALSLGRAARSIVREYVEERRGHAVRRLEELFHARR